MRVQRGLVYVALVYVTILLLQLGFPRPYREHPVRYSPMVIPLYNSSSSPDVIPGQHNPHDYVFWRDSDPRLPTAWRVTSPAGTYSDYAYVLVLSNERFVDGAIVMGSSLLEVSKGLQSSVIQLVVVVTAGRLCETSINRLIATGFDVLIEVPSLAVKVPEATFKDTFDKIYIFGLTIFKKIVYMDADMLAVRSPDTLFDKDYGPDENWLGAIGFRDKDGDYFQTGMMVIRPSLAVFDRIMEEFEANAPPHGKKYNRGMNGRDGVLLRTVFKSNFKPIDNRFSRNLNPRYRIPASVVCIHLRGIHKPWFDWHSPVSNPELGKKEFGFTYLAWWEVYERAHRQSAEYRESLEDNYPRGYGGRFASVNVTPLTHVWLLRYTTDEYVQLLSDVEARVNNKTVPGLRIVAGSLGQSCDAVCRKNSNRCFAEAFNFTSLRDCDKMKLEFGCKDCELAVYWRHHPHSGFPGMDTVNGHCKWNLMRDHRSRSTCEAFNETTRRWCPCV